ncbi:MAG: hypothetical protein ABL903_08210 [Methylococcales bacterium]
MFKVKLAFSLMVLGVCFQSGYAEDSVSSALLKTQECLRSQACAAAKTDAGMAADLKALETVNGSNGGKQTLYNIAADIMPILEKQAGGDPQKMQEIILKAQTDPAGFLNSLPPDLQAKIKNASIAIQ